MPISSLSWSRKGSLPKGIGDRQRRIRFRLFRLSRKGSLPKGIGDSIVAIDASTTTVTSRKGSLPKGIGDAAVSRRRYTSSFSTTSPTRVNSPARDAESAAHFSQGLPCSSSRFPDHAPAPAQARSHLGKLRQRLPLHSVQDSLPLRHHARCH